MPKLYGQWLWIQQCRDGEKSRWLPSVSLILAVAIHLLIMANFTSLSATKLPTMPHELFFEVQWVAPLMAQETEQKHTPKTSTPPIVHAKASTPKASIKTPKKPSKAKPKHKLKSQVKIPKPISAKSIQSQHAVMPTRTATQTIVHHNKTTATPNKSSSTLSRQKQAQQKHIDQDYIANIIALINKHKSYPYAARRRHLEGDIHITFVIGKDGHIHELHITGIKASLRRASIAALEAAQPLPKSPRSLPQAIQVNFIMQYRLKH
ncbi:MAG: energy transducer TonB [Mariprofundaceae bacterium]|nr:energy transducer TonB [Mariprofundaceae bacterium]